MPVAGELMGDALGGGGGQWLARLEEWRTAYAAVLLDQLKQAGRSCVVIKSFPYPDLYLIDFSFECNR